MFFGTLYPIFRPWSLYQHNNPFTYRIMRKKIVRYSLLGLLIVLLAMQFVRIDKTKPPTDPAQDFLTVSQAAPAVATLIQETCYDCHSHQTEYPWYSNIAPVSWLLKNHVEEGREHLNFSIWGTYSGKKQAHKLEECSEEVGEGEMPMKSFLITHPEARLSDAQRAELVGWFNSQYQQMESQGAAEHEGEEERHEEGDDH
jgi:hypothetical protein